MRTNKIIVKSRIRLEGLQGEKISGVVQSFDKKALKVKTATGTIIIPWKQLGGYWKTKKV